MRGYFADHNHAVRNRTTDFHQRACSWSIWHIPLLLGQERRWASFSCSLPLSLLSDLLLDGIDQKTSPYSSRMASTKIWCVCDGQPLFFFSYCSQLGLQSEADKFFIYLAALILVTLVSAALAIALRAASPSLDVAMGLLLPSRWYPFVFASLFFLIPLYPLQLSDWGFLFFVVVQLFSLGLSFLLPSSADFW